MLTDNEEEPITSDIDDKVSGYRAKMILLKDERYAGR
jgi:hypothetical protein